MNLAQARALVRVLEVAGAHPLPEEMLDPTYQQVPVVRVEPTDHGDGNDLEVTLAFYAAASAKLPSALYLSVLGAWHVWDGDTNEETPVAGFRWHERTRGGWAFCALAADDLILTPYLPEEQT